MVNVNYDIYRKELEKTYDGLATVYEKQDVEDPQTHITSKQEVEVLTGQPCRISYKSIQSVKVNEAASSTVQEVKLFISPDVTIKPGSKIVITQYGVTQEYERSGKPAVYPTHQEIILQLFEGWS